jgi:hypothetical protein
MNLVGSKQSERILRMQDGHVSSRVDQEGHAGSAAQLG